MIKRIISVLILVFIIITPFISYFDTSNEIGQTIDNEILFIEKPIYIEETETKYINKYTNKESELLMNDGSILSVIPINTLLYVEDTNSEYSAVMLDDMETKIKSTNLSLTETSLISYDIPDIDTSFKAYTDYKYITDKTSKQYQIVQDSYTDCHGIRRMNRNNDFVVALGTYYAEEVGVRFLISLDTGVELFATVGDIKANIHTEGTNRFILHNGNVVEFYIDSEVIDKGVIKHGDLSYYDQFKGNISKIEKIPE